MARFIDIEYGFEHAGINRVTQGVAALGRFNAVHSVIGALAAIGAPIRRRLGEWAEARRLRREDERLWQVALTDARVMADLSRAMSQAAGDLRKMY